MRKLLVVLCSLSCMVSQAMIMPNSSPARKVSLYSGSVLRGDMDLQRSHHYLHGLEYSHHLQQNFAFAALFDFSNDRNFQARNSYLTENLYGLHLIAYFSYSFLLRFSVGAGPSLRIASSEMGIRDTRLYRTWQYGPGAIASFKVDYAITPSWEFGYHGAFDFRLPEPRSVWRNDVVHQFGVGYRF